MVSAFTVAPLRAAMASVKLKTSSTLPFTEGSPAEKAAINDWAKLVTSLPTLTVAAFTLPPVLLAP